MVCSRMPLLKKESEVGGSSHDGHLFESVNPIFLVVVLLGFLKADLEMVHGDCSRIKDQTDVGEER